MEIVKTRSGYEVQRRLVNKINADIALAVLPRATFRTTLLLTGRAEATPNSRGREQSIEEEDVGEHQDDAEDVLESDLED